MFGRLFATMAAVIAFMKVFGRRGRSPGAAFSLACRLAFGLVVTPLVTGAGLSAFAAPAQATTATASPPAPRAFQGRKKKRTKARPPGGDATTKRHRRRRAAATGVMASRAPAPARAGTLVASPGPLQTPEALRSMDKVRRDQIDRAESAARRPELTNRWETVSFLLSGVEPEQYPEAGFWRTIASYRRGDVEAGDATRQGCRLPPQDMWALDRERTVATMLAARDGGASAGMQTAVFTSQQVPAGGAGARNNAAYTGAGPTPRIAHSPPH